MQELDKLIDKLNTDTYSAVSVFDLNTNSFLFRNITHAQIIQSYQSAEDFFETLFAKGHRRLNLSPKRKNGSSYKTDGHSFEVNFSEQNQIPQAPQLPQVPIQPQQTTQSEMFSNSFGLGTLDIMNLMVAKNDASRLFTEAETLKAENKELKKKYEDIREEQLLSKYNADKESGLWGAVQGAVQNAPALLAAFKGTTPMAGLAAPMQSYTSEVKENFAMTLQSTDDTVVQVLQSITNALDTNSEFSNELAQLLKKHQLWQA